MLKQRVITGVLMALSFVALMFAPALVKALVFTALATIALWEFLSLCRLTGILRALFCAVMFAVFCTVCYRFNEVPPVFIKTVLGAASALWAVIFLWVLSYPVSAKLWGAKPSKVIQGLCLLSGACLAFTVISFAPNAVGHLLFVVALIAAADIGAYFAGKSFGRHKLAPSVSPSKTWEGFAGGSLAVLLLAVVVVLWFDEIVFLNPLGFVVLAVVCGCASVVGDLYESMIKREVGAKDSSQLLPGHGGLLDRIDGLIAAAALYTFVMVNTPSL